MPPSGTAHTALACLGSRLLDTLLPRHCILCGLASGTANLCPSCRFRLPRNARPCIRCGLPLLPGTATGSQPLCGPCLRRPPPWSEAVAPLLYRFPVDQLVCRFKFSRDLASGEVLAQELSAALRLQDRPPPRCIVPVPLYRSRQRRRLFNQAELLAGRLSRELCLPLDCRLLRRTRSTSAQSGLTAAERRRNIRGAFACRRALTRGEHVALVDDVMTTGATLAECSRVLSRAGANTVSVWVAARAPKT